ncbi:MAG: hypothetical protein Q4P66_03200 [Actinomycetaceae bacterium]|nr:hypothetical protein [Actinomycetaceae bacterium]
MKRLAVVLFLSSVVVLGCSQADANHHTPEGAVRLFIEGIAQEDARQVCDSLAPDTRKEYEKDTNSCEEFIKAHWKVLSGNKTVKEKKEIAKNYAYKAKNKKANDAVVLISGAKNTNVECQCTKVEGKWYLKNPC